VDHLRRRDLLGLVVAVAGGVVDPCRGEQAGVVVAAQGADAQVGQLSELADDSSVGTTPV
jgi:hypothetical protein